MRVTDVFLAFPALLLSLALAVVLHAQRDDHDVAIAITWWPWYTRLIRGQAASVAGAALRRELPGARRVPTRGSSSATSCRTRSRR